MNFLTAALIASVVTIILGYLATQPYELRAHRWLKIVLSLPPTLVITSAGAELNRVNGCFAVFSLALLAFIWKAPLAHAGSLVFVRLIHGDMNRVTSGIRAEFGAARALHKHGDLEDALRHTKAELEKDPFNYEGLLLLAQIHIDLEETERALDCLDQILEKTPLTDDQRRAIQHTRTAVEDSILVVQ